MNKACVKLICLSIMNFQEYTSRGNVNLFDTVQSNVNGVQNVIQAAIRLSVAGLVMCWALVDE